MSSCARDDLDLSSEERQNLPETEYSTEYSRESVDLEEEEEDEDLQLSGSFTFLLTDAMEGKRLDACLSEFIPGQSRSFLQKQITAGKVKLLQSSEQDPALGISLEKAGRKMKAGEILSVTIPEPEEIHIEAEDIPLDILYEDADLLVVNKPKGMVVHPAPGHYSHTLVNALMYHCRDQLSGINGVLRPGIVHRIDRDTTGSLLVCKNDRAHKDLSIQLREHTINRRYRAIVLGNLREDSGTIDAPIGRHPTDRKKMAVNQRNGRHAVTHYQVLERFGSYTYVECRLETGRTHQIRVHMTSIGHPLLGDSVYGPQKCPYRLEGQTLHAMVLGFRHPTTGDYMEFTAPLPEYFEDLLRKMRAQGS